MKFSQLGRSFFRKMVQMCSNFATTCTIRGTRGAKLPVDATFSGRSMVEMLGVLAIIGVLSVGAIAGYSKAMMKYKLNKQREQITTLIYNAFELYNRPEFNAQNVSSSFTYLVPVMYKLGLIPANELYRNQGFEDAMGNLILLSWIREGNAYGDGYFRLTVEHDNNIIANSYVDFNSCQNILTVVQQMHSDLWKVTPQVGNGGSIYEYYGDKYCNTSKNLCLRDLTLTKIGDICADLDGKRSWINILWI